MNTLSTHRRTISPEASAELEALVFDLVRERLLKAVGAGGMWTLQFRASTDTDTLFGETISEFIARDIANQLAMPATITSVDAAMIETEAAEVEAVESTVEGDLHPVVEEIRVERSEWTALPVTIEADAERVVESAVDVVVEHEEYDEHRMFKPRKAA